jgi:ATP-dependent RNA helicase RhlE
VGDAISFVTPEDHGELRALERFIGRGIVRKRAEGFDYQADAPQGADAFERERGPRHGHARPSSRGSTSPQAANLRRGGFASHRMGSGQRWRR